MEGLGIQYNSSTYNVFAICEEFRQRLAQLQRLTEQAVNETTEKD